MLPVNKKIIRDTKSQYHVIKVHSKIIKKNKVFRNFKRI